MEVEICKGSLRVRGDQTPSFGVGDGPRMGTAAHDTLRKAGPYCDITPVIGCPGKYPIREISGSAVTDLI
jgi:hypothetical protein